jgi:PD-(D/E)XK nuclease superfamily
VIVTYIRSSLMANYDFCKMQSFLSYNLGLPRVNAKKALLGTMTHKVLELLAKLKQEYQVNQQDSITITDELGEVSTSWNELNRLSTLTNIEVEQVNKTRLNKETYKWCNSIPYDHMRYGVDVVEDLIQRVYHYYKSHNEHCEWQPIDIKHVRNWVWMTVDYKNGIFDPRRRTIVQPEIHFDIPINRPWAKYKYYIGDKIIEGQLAIKGTIDLVTALDGGYEIIDYKSGQRKDWATGEVKTFEKLSKDKQLMLYYYAARHVFPDISNIILSIFFIRDGGPFSMHFGDEHLDEMENILRVEFTKMTKDNLPKMVDPTQKDFKCQRICDFYKQKMGDTNVCRHIHNELHTIGMEKVIEKYKQPGFDFNVYQAPGEI